MTSKFRKDYQYTRLGAQVQNVKKSKVFVFGEDDICNEDEVVEFEMNSIPTRRGKKREGNSSRKDDTPPYVERKITEDDTLQTLSLQYGCPISELKRVNKLIRDQDFFALTKIKIPVKQHSFLIDQIQNESKLLEQTSNTRSNSGLSNGAAYIDSEDERTLSLDSESERTSQTDLSDPETQRSVIREISINRATRSQTREAKKFLQNMDKDLSKLRGSTRTDRNSLDEVISVLTNKSVNPLVQFDRQKPEKLTECRIGWRNSVILLVIVSIGVPIIFVVAYFIYKKSH